MNHNSDSITGIILYQLPVYRHVCTLSLVSSEEFLLLPDLSLFFWYGLLAQLVARTLRMIMSYPSDVVMFWPNKYLVYASFNNSLQ